MKLLLTIDLPQQADWLLPKPWAAALLAALQQTLALEYPTPGTEPERDQLPAWLRGCEVSLLLTDNPAIHRLNPRTCFPFRSIRQGRPCSRTVAWVIL